MGFLRDQEGIMNRYLREKTSWKAHLEKTRAFLNKSFSDQPIQSVAVLGSGWLLDVPLEQMTRRFSKIYLVDIHHPPQIRRKVRDMENVQLISSDLSGNLVEQIWELPGSKSNKDLILDTNRFKLSVPLQDISPDAFLSVNLLNQLDIILCDYLSKKGYFQQNLPPAFRSKIQEFHLEWITSLPGCLITDTKEVSIDENGNETFNSLLHTDLPSGFRSDSWSWDFDNTGSYRPGTRTRMEVQAIEWS
jgi:hypothetical protein